MKKKVKLIIITIILCIVTFIMGYYVTLTIDNAKIGDNVNIKVTYEDTDKASILSIKKMTKDEALKEWPYIFHIENTGSDKGLFQIIIKGEDSNNINDSDLEYILEESEKEVSSGNLSSIKNNILYEGKIDGIEKKEYKLYIYSNKDLEDDSVFEYTLKFNVIKMGGPGF